MLSACHKDVFVVAQNHDYYCKHGLTVVINSNVTASFPFIEIYPLGEKQEKRK